MSITNLTAHELRELISRYQSELRKLEYQANKTYGTIRELEDAFFQTTGQSQRPPDLPTSRSVLSSPTPAGPAPAQPAPKKQTKTPEVERQTAKATPSGRRKSSKPARAVDAETSAKDEGEVFTILPKKTPKKPKKTGGKGKRKRVVKTDGYRLSDWDNFIINSLNEQGIILRNADFYELAKNWVQETGEDIDKTEIRGKISRSIHKLANKRGYIIKVKYPGRGNAYALPDWFTSGGKLKKMHSAG